MTVWVDADACPVAVKQILFRAAERRQVPVVLVANSRLDHPTSRFIRSVRVAAGLDVADRYIADAVEPGDLVVTADIPLAADVVRREALALEPRGELLTGENVHERLATRDLMDQLRSAGLDTGGPSSFGTRERQAFANALDRFLTRALSGGGPGLEPGRE